jgi:LysM repeat protein
LRTRAVIVISALALSASASTSTYVLQAGDTLTRVASRLGVDVATLASANNISNPRTLRAGAKLAVPPRLHTHTVKRGDTLAEIARWYGTSVNDLKGRNGLKRSTIRLGQHLTVPLPAHPSAPKPVRIETKPISHVAGHVHTVKKGDTLAEIARHYGTSTTTVKRLNGLTNSRLKQGQKLTVPEPPAPPAPKVSEMKGLCPVKGARKYDFSDSWGSARHGGRRHRGNDIFAKRGTPVLANVGGTLRYAHGTVAGYAYYLQGDDGHLYYGAHLDKVTVKPGRVDKGDVIGTVGTSGNAMGTPPHLHFEIKPRGGAAVDPHAILKSWCP